uniref:Uncharacterized protein n=1 Tax=viral metagenome TaxID=1070528 RepID=A0A6H2A5X2_9ZZZZ
MKKRCFNYIDGYDTGGNPIKKRQCYCNATACDETDFDYESQEEIIKLIEEETYKRLYNNG